LIKKLIFLILLISFIVWLRNTEYAHLLTFENLKANTDNIKNYVSENYLSSALTYIVAYIAVAGLNIPGAAVMSLGGGFVFGVGAGLFLSVTSATLGASLAFIMARYIAGEAINRKYETQLSKFNKELSENGYLYMLTLRLVPIFPFFLINIMAGLTKIRLATFFWTTLVGMIPGGFVFIYAGSRLSEVTSPSDIFSAGMISAFALFGALMLVPVIFKKIKRDKA
jgi:uncharacterized membrane protein YdjX (TVP38/TMEM64 family)